MVARVATVSFEGISVKDIDVQVQISNGLPAFSVVGLPDKAVAESRERVRAALHAMGLSLPSKRVTVNLSPADVIKEGAHYDLPIALGLLSAMQVFPGGRTGKYPCAGGAGTGRGNSFGKRDFARCHSCQRTGCHFDLSCCQCR